MRSFLAAPMLIALAAAGAGDARAVYLDAVRTMMPRDRYDQMIEGMYRPLVASAEANAKQKMAPEAVQQLKDAARGAMTYDELLGWTADAYQKRFSPEEMKQMMAFFRSPVGKKLEKEQPQVAADVMRKVGEVVPTRMEATLRKAQQQQAPAKKP